MVNPPPLEHGLDSSPPEHLGEVGEVLHDGVPHQILHQVPVAKVLASVTSVAALRYLYSQLEVPGGNTIDLELH